MNSLMWTVRRELWENRSLYIAPLAVAVLILIAFAIGPGLLEIGAVRAGRVGLDEQPFTLAALLLMFTTFVVGVVYCLDALYGERRDRSILFWKSLPVSDTTAVLAKAVIPIVVLPLVTFAVTFVTQALMLSITSARLIGTDLRPWSEMPFWRTAALLFNHLVVGHGLWYAPIWGWLLFCSAWSRRVPYLWAALPLLALALVERIAFNTSYFAAWLSYRFTGGPAVMRSDNTPMTMATMTPTALQYLTSPGLWFGLALTVVFLSVAIRLRRSRGPI